MQVRPSAVLSVPAPVLVSGIGSADGDTDGADDADVGLVLGYRMDSEINILFALSKSIMGHHDVDFER